MEKRLESIYDWVCRIIDTCSNDFHFEAVDRLIDLFYEREKDEAKKIELQLRKQDKWNEIHYILK